MNIRYIIEIKKDKGQWKRLSVSTLSPQAIDGHAYLAQYAVDHQLNPDTLSWRIAAIDGQYVGAKTSPILEVVTEYPSSASVNRPAV